MPLLFEHLDNCFARYTESYERLKRLDETDELYSMVRDSLVKRFEFTWDAYVKAIERCLIEDLANASAVEALTYKEQMIHAQKKGYISSAENWITFRKLRNKTSHTYFEAHAITIAKESSAFFDELSFYIPKLKAGHEELTLGEND
jgi:nucleotidyltransferase substrate binding protein (TIGR01987 family)